MAVTKEEANRLRATIVELASRGLGRREIARLAGCALSTVYRVLGAPGPDRRGAGGGANRCPLPEGEGPGRTAASARYRGSGEV
jgi:hypothetical protein